MFVLKSIAPSPYDTPICAIMGICSVVHLTRFFSNDWCQFLTREEPCDFVFFNMYYIGIPPLFWKDFLSFSCSNAFEDTGFEVKTHIL